MKEDELSPRPASIPAQASPAQVVPLNRLYLPLLGLDL
jgi:hypothetical protein